MSEPILTPDQLKRLRARLKASATKWLADEKVSAGVDDYTLARIESDKITLEITVLGESPEGN